MVVYGRNIVIEALKSAFSVEEVLLENSFYDKTPEKILEVIKLSKSRGVKIITVTRNDIKKITKGEEHQGIAARIKFSLSSSLKEFTKTLEKDFIFILESTFEHNLGAIIRSAECAGFGGVILPKEAEITPTVAKSSAGALFHISIFSGSIFQVIKHFKESGYKVRGIERDGANYFETNLNFPTLYIIGGENKSITKPVREQCDDILEIKQFGKVNSLNMSVAAAIVMFEANRQKSISS